MIGWIGGFVLAMCLAPLLHVGLVGGFFMGFGLPLIGYAVENILRTRP